MEEKKEYLKKQIITYLGNKRTLIDYIEIEIKLIQEKLKCDKTVNLDLFSGSGIVARMMKKYSSKIIANDLEDYSFLINSCYLENESSFDKVSFDKIHKKIMSSIKTTPFEGFITELYAPKNSKKIKRNERVFFTRENAIIIDSMLHYVKKNVPSEMRKFFIAPLLSEASIKNNTAGVFKGFYKDKNTGIGRFGGTGEYSLSRILAPIEVNEPIFSAFDSKFEVYKEDANELVKKLKGIDITYIDPPYNQHPYGSNYFMLNLIARNTAPSDISKISGIPNDWNRSRYNKKQDVYKAFESLIAELDTKFAIVSYNSDGFISKKHMLNILRRYGTVNQKEIVYNTYKGGRNLSERDLYVKEYLFILEKGKNNE